MVCFDSSFSSPQNFGQWAIQTWGVRFRFQNQDVLNNGNDLLPPAGVSLPVQCEHACLKSPKLC
jgi:hypothetical protein